MGLMIATKEIDKILLASIVTSTRAEEHLTLPFRKLKTCPINPLISSGISNCFRKESGSDDMSNNSDKASFKQDLANTSEYPLNCIGKLEVSFSNGKLIQSTCAIIHHNKVLTLITNIYSEEAGRATTIALTLGSSTYYDVTEEQVFPLYAEDKAQKNNFMMLSFEGLSVKNWFGIERPKIDSLYRKTVNLCGFISTLEGLYSCNGKILRQQDNTIKYSIVCEKGQEGSPLFFHFKVNDPEDNNDDEDIEVDNEYDTANGANLIGLHFLSEEGREGQGSVINDAVFNWIKKILEQEEKSNVEGSVIEKLDFSHKNFGPHEMEYLILFQSRHLKEIDLTFNHIKAQGVYFLSKGNYPQLSKLSLNNNEIGDLGVRYLSLAKFHHLKELRLLNNHLTYRAVEFLSDSYFNNKLALLDLSHNPKVGDKGVKMFKKKWESIVELNLHFVGMTDKSKNVMNKIKRPSLKKLILTGNSFNADTKMAITSLRMAKVNVVY